MQAGPSAGTPELVAVRRSVDKKGAVCVESKDGIRLEESHWSSERRKDGSQQRKEYIRRFQNFECAAETTAWNCMAAWVSSSSKSPMAGDAETKGKGDVAGGEEERGYSGSGGHLRLKLCLMWSYQRVMSRGKAWTEGNKREAGRVWVCASSQGRRWKCLRLVGWRVETEGKG